MQAGPSPALGYQADLCGCLLCRDHTAAQRSPGKVRGCQLASAALQAPWKMISDSADPASMVLSQPWADKLTSFQKLLVLRTLRPDKMVVALRHFVRSEMGTQFVEPPPFDLNRSALPAWPSLSSTTCMFWPACLYSTACVVVPLLHTCAETGQSLTGRSPLTRTGLTCLLTQIAAAGLAVPGLEALTCSSHHPSRDPGSASRQALCIGLQACSSSDGITCSPAGATRTAPV